MMFNGKIDAQRAAAIGRILYQKYDYDKKGHIDKGQCYTLFSENVYRGLGLSNVPSHDDSESMLAVLDSNKDNRVSSEDIEALAVRYLCQMGGVRATPKVKVLTSVARKRLDVARRLFEQFDKDKSGYLTQAEVPLIITETYKELGQTFIPTKEDVDSWMFMTDTNRDGKVTLQQFQDLVYKSLEKCGIQIYQ